MTCWEAIAEVFANETGILSTAQVIERVYAKYPDQPWRRNTIQAHLIGLSVNHPTSRHYPSQRKHAFLFSLGGGRYRRWNPETDGIWEVTDKGVQVAGASEEAETEAVEELETTASDTTFSLERDLEKGLLSNLAQLEPNLRLYNENGISGQQLDTGSVGRLDFLCIDQNGDLVVIELKAGKVDDKVCGQILRYMGWVIENLAHGRKVRGIIVANEFSESLTYAAVAMTNVVLKKYEMRFTFTNI